MMMMMMMKMMIIIIIIINIQGKIRQRTLVCPCTVPKSVETNLDGKVTILWNQQARTDRNIPKNKPDIIVHDNKQRTCMLIDGAIPGDRNVIKKEVQKILKYKDLKK